MELLTLLIAKHVHNFFVGAIAEKSFWKVASSSESAQREPLHAWSAAV